MRRIIVFLSLIVAVGLLAAGLYLFRAAAEPAGGDGQVAEAADPASTRPSPEAADAAEGETAVPVTIADVGVGDVSTYITATANLVPDNEVKVLAEAEGRVSHLTVEEGDRVQRGQLLAALLRDDAEIAFEKAKLKAANAEMAFERAQRIFREKLIAQEEYDKTTMDHRIAQQELAEAKRKLDKTEIRSPFDGRLTRRNVTLGQHIRPGDELFTVTDFDPLIARIYLPERDVLALEEGREVGITLKADSDVSFRGRIRQISPVVDTATGTVKVTVAAIRPPAIVRPGGFVTIEIVRETHAATTLVPRKAVIRELKNAHVFVARDGVAHKRTVELGLEDSERLEITSGLEPGEQIVVAGQGGLKDGSTIKVLPEEDLQARSPVEPRDRG